MIQKKTSYSGFILALLLILCILYVIFYYNHTVVPNDATSVTVGQNIVISPDAPVIPNQGATQIATNDVVQGDTSTPIGGDPDIGGVVGDVGGEG